MIGVPMPPTPDEPDPRMVQRPEERQPWEPNRILLGEGDENLDRLAARRTAVVLTRLIQEARR